MLPCIFETRQPACLHNLAGDEGVFVEHVDRAKAMVAVGDNQFARSRVPHQQEWRKLLTVLDFLLILLDMRIAHTEQGMPGGAKDVLCLEIL